VLQPSARHAAGSNRSGSHTPAQPTHQHGLLRVGARLQQLPDVLQHAVLQVPYVRVQLRHTALLRGLRLLLLLRCWLLCRLRLLLPCGVGGGRRRGGRGLLPCGWCRGRRWRNCGRGGWRGRRHGSHCCCAWRGGLRLARGGSRRRCCCGHRAARLLACSSAARARLLLDCLCRRRLLASSGRSCCCCCGNVGVHGLRAAPCIPAAACSRGGAVRGTARRCRRRRRLLALCDRARVVRLPGLQRKHLADDLAHEADDVLVPQLEALLQQLLEGLRGALRKQRGLVVQAAPDDLPARDEEGARGLGLRLGACVRVCVCVCVCVRGRVSVVLSVSARVCL
jgi:hypothetical protein